MEIADDRETVFLIVMLRKASITTFALSGSREAIG